MIEILLILLVVGIVWYLIHQNNPRTKFSRAKALFDKGDYLESISILETIFDKHPDAPAEIAEIQCSQGIDLLSTNTDAAIGFFGQVLEIRKKLSSNANKELYEKFEAKAHLETSRIFFSRLANTKSSKDKVDKINQNINYIDNSVKADLIIDFARLRKKHLSLLSSVYYDLGLENENSFNIIEAIREYNEALSYAKQSSNSDISNKVICRIEICKMKNGEFVDIKSFTEINSAPKSFRSDFFYRYSIKLIERKNYATAEKIINEYLDSKNKKVAKLNEFIRVDRRNSAIKIINDINQSLDLLYNESLSINDIKKIYEELDKNINFIKPIIPKAAEKLRKLKPSLFNRLLTYYINQKQFADAINLIQKIRNFWENPELLKNLGICCYGFAAQGLITENNYKIIISNWLTAVYSDNVILKSLEDMSWDDNYTFTIIDTIGSSYAIFKNLPDNVNNEEVSDKNISIGATQRELVNQFEAIIREKIIDPKLMRLINDYYSFEKEAIEELVSIIEKDILFAGPNFAKTHGLNRGIILHLENDYVRYSNENALAAAIPYFNNMTGVLVKEYLTAKKLVENVSNAIEKENINSIKAANNDQNKTLIGKFYTINDKLEDTLFNKISLKIEQRGNNEKLIQLFEEAVKFSPSNEKLKYQYSTYVANYCVSKVNDGEITNYHALKLMLPAYLHTPDNPRICKNIVTLISFNLMDILNKRTNNRMEIYSILDKILINKSDVFKQSSYELKDARENILSDLRKAGVDVTLFIDDLFTLTRLHSSKSLTNEGKELKKVLDYYNKLSDSRSTLQRQDRLQKLGF